MRSHDAIFAELMRLAREQGRTLTASYTGIVGLVIAVLRREKGLSQTALADASGISQATISRIELGEADITIPQMDGFASALGTTPAFLLEVSDDFRNKLQKENIVVSSRSEKESGGTGKGNANSNSDYKRAMKGAAAIAATGAVLGGGPIGLLIGAAVGAIISAKKANKRAS